MNLKLVMINTTSKSLNLSWYYHAKERTQSLEGSKSN